jgi:hypothetical protein
MSHSEAGALLHRNFREALEATISSVSRAPQSPGVKGEGRTSLHTLGMAGLAERQHGSEQMHQPFRWQTPRYSLLKFKPTPASS